MAIVTLIFAIFSTFTTDSSKDSSELEYYRSQARHFESDYGTPTFSHPESPNEVVATACQQDGKFPYPGNCKKYIECWKGQSVIKSCPFQLYFDNYLGCTIKSLVNCQESNDDFACSEDYGQFQYPLDCHKFYQCTDGEAYLNTCLGGLEFDNRFGCVLKSSTCA